MEFVLGKNSYVEYCRANENKKAYHVVGIRFSVEEDIKN